MYIYELPTLNNSFRMKQLDKIASGLIIGFSIPLFFSLSALLLWFYLDRNESNALACVGIGFFLGIIIDFVFLKRLIRFRYELPIWFIAAIYIFYNILMYGFFMGFPVFNVFLGSMAAYYFGKRIHFRDIPEAEHSGIVNRVSLFTTSIMTLICISSGFIALAGNGVGKDLQMMARLNFEPTKEMILAVALVGGSVLIVSEYYLTKIILNKTIQSSH